MVAALCAGCSAQVEVGSLESKSAGKPEVSIYLDRPKAADLGVSIADAADVPAPQ